MKGLSKFLGRGMLVLALGSYVVACGDDDDDTNETDGGGGTSGGSGKGAGSSGKGGTGGTSTAGKGGDGAMTMEPTVKECMDTAADTTMDMATSDCTECLCMKAPQEVTDCSADCWSLANCVAAKCPPKNGMNDVPCITSMCADFIGAAAEAMAVPFTMCAADCFMTTPPPDGEVEDAGN